MTCASFAHAAEPPVDPLPRVEVGAHIDRVTGFDYYPSRNWLLSASDDGTVRAWDADSGRLVDTIRVPAEHYKDGELYSLAVNPKSGFVVVGGWTGIEWDGRASVYVIDPKRRKMLGRLVNMPDRVLAMDFSPDGSLLAVSLMNGELKLFSGSDFKLLAESDLCNTIAHRMDFSRDNRLVTNCFDGKVRVYDDRLQVLVERSFSPKKPAGVVFQPGGLLIAVAFYDHPQILLLDGETLETLGEVDTRITEGAVQRNLAWSSDGQSLFAGGDMVKDGVSYLVRWRDQGRGAPQLLEAGRRKIFRVLSLPDNGVAFTTLEHAVGVVGEDGTRRFVKEPLIVDHLNREAGLLVSQDAAQVTFDLDSAGMVVTYDVTGSSYEIGPQIRSNIHRAPITSSKEIRVDNWRHDDRPSLNGKRLELYPNQESHALAIAPNDQYFVLALDGELRCYSASGEVLWSNVTTSGPFTVNVSGDNRSIVAGMQDGSVRWYRAEDGVEYFALFPHGNREDWVAWVPDGFYVSSPNGDRYIGWQLNNGKDQLADFYSAWQFERFLYRPDLILDYFRHRGRPPQIESKRAEYFVASDIREAAPPDVSISIEENIGNLKDYVTLSLGAKIRRQPIREYSVYVNGVPVTPHRERSISGSESTQFTRAHRIPLFDRGNEITVEVMTDRSIGVAKTYLEVEADVGEKRRRRGDLYLFAVGVNQLQYMPHNNLDFAAQDAQAVVGRLAESGLFRRVHTTLISDFSERLPTRENIEKALTFLRESGPEDTVVLFLAAHGLSNRAGDYFLVPRDARIEDLAVLAKENVRESPVSLIRWDVFFQALRGASGKRVLIVDTCQAKQIEGNFDVVSLAKRSAAASFALFAASKEDEPSQEYGRGGHGLFTYALLDALNGKGDRNNDGQVDLRETYQHTRRFVADNLDPSLGQQTPQLVAPRVLQEMVLVTARP